MKTRSIEAEGFLSPEVEQYRQQIRKEFAELLLECESASRAATSRLFRTEPFEAVPSVMVALSLWGRCISACQAAILLGERGMDVDASTMLRNALENLFYCAAIAKRPDILPRLVGNDQQERLKQARAMMSNASTFDCLTPENQKRLKEFVEEKAVDPSKESFSVFDAAEIAGLDGLYHGAYRTLSRVAAHPSLTTASHAFGESLGDMLFGPSTRHLLETFALTCDCLKIGDGFMAPILEGTLRSAQFP